MREIHHIISGVCENRGDFSFRSPKVAVSFHPPEKRKISADIKGERLYGFEVMDFGYSGCR